MIDFAPIADILVELAVVVITVLGAYAVARLKKHLDISDNSVLNELLNEALERGVAYAETKLKLQGKKLTIETSKQVVADAANYAIKGVPRLMVEFGLTEERIKEMVEARLNEKLK